MTSRYSFYPVEDPELHEHYEILQSMYWIAKEVPLTEKNRQEWDELDENTRRFLTFVLAFFSSADGIINENISEHFQQDVKYIKSAGHFYSVQEANEVTHNQVYGLLLQTFIRDPTERAEALDAISCEKYKSIKNLADWALNWMGSDKSFLERLLSTTCVEMLFFCSAFAAIYWIKRRNILEGLTTSNEWIARDEAVHCNFAISLWFNVIKRGTTPPTHERITEIVMDAVRVEEEFVRDALHVDLIGLKADEMVAYVKCTADALLQRLGCPKAYNVENPFDWMVMIGLGNKSNFFEKDVTEYKKGSKDDEFDLYAEF
jgi:ribonucleotide reductase beta subunit family protein with ferritin-like domain